MDMKYHHWPETMTTVQVPFVPQNKFVAFVLETYGRPQRNAAVQCDCERDGSGSIFHVLTLANHPRVWEKIKDPIGRTTTLLKAEGDMAGKIEKLYLATVSRLPTKRLRSVHLNLHQLRDSLARRPVVPDQYSRISVAALETQPTQFEFERQGGAWSDTRFNPRVLVEK
jgi:hypothetical protein